MHTLNDKHLLTLSLTLAALLSACGGGGGGDNDPPDTQITTNPTGNETDTGNGESRSISYNGKNTPALITSGNAKKLVSNSYAITEGGSSLGAPITQASVGNTGPERPLQSARALSAIVSSSATRTEELMALRGNPDGEMSAAAMNSHTMQGSCGGTASYRMETNETTGEFSGSFTYDQYCEDDLILNGAMHISGTVDRALGTTYMSFRFDFIQSRDRTGSESTTTAGTITMTETDMQTDTVMNLLSRDDRSGDVYKLEDLKISENERGNYVESTIQGRFYDPREGYVELSTVIRFRTYAMDDYPKEGKMRLDGANGTFATLTANPDGYTYTMEADTNGDGLIDLSETVAWEQ